MPRQAVQGKVDSLFESLTQPGSPGCALGVMKDGELIYKQGYGLANLEYDIPNTPCTIFHVASMSKQFTALAVALLVDAGELSFDDDIRQHLPEIPGYGETITIRHLIHHTSGLRSDLILLVSAGWRLEDVITNTDVLELVKRQRNLNFHPGEKFAYGGVGYLLLAEIVAQVSGHSFAEYCHEQIFEPLGMINTHFQDDYLRVVKNRAYAYYPAGDDHYQNAILTCALVGGTGLYTTIEDLALWDENFYTGQVGSQSVIEQIHQRGVLNNGEEIDYAFGLILDKYRGRDVVVHGGDGAGVHSYMMRFPEEHFSVAVLGNHGALKARQLAQQVADLYLGDAQVDAPADASAAAVPETIELEEAQLCAKAGRYYDADTAAFIDIEFKDGKLQIWGHDLAPVSKHNFVFAAFPEASTDFRPATATAPAQVLVDTGMTRTRYDWAEPVMPTPDILRGYTGRYYSPELDVYWTITLDGDNLVVQRKRQGRSPLTPIIADVFSDGWIGPILHSAAKPMTLAFERDANNAVSGFRLSDSGGRVCNLVFIKKGN
jgi:CubicO group peptidase (beta-lactamase class C family)